MIVLAIAWSLIAIGSFFLLASIIGILRLADFYTRVHAAGINDTLGTPIICLGVALLQPTWLLSFKLILLVLLLWLLNPLVTHILAQFTWLNFIVHHSTDPSIEHE